MPQVTQASIQEFLTARRIAVVGVSRNPRDYSRALFRALRDHGYEALPVHPEADQVDGIPCHRSVKDIRPAPERAILLLPADRTERAVVECAEAGVGKVWLHRRLGSGVPDTRAIFQAEQRGLELITGLCPFMFLPKAGFIHRFHGGVLRLMGTLPR